MAVSISFIDGCRFLPTAGGTTDWTYSSAVTGFQSPALANAINASVYAFRAQSADQTQWEITTGAYNSSTGVFARTTVLYNSSGTGSAAGQSSAGTKISFSSVPQVAIITLAEAMVCQQIGQLPGTATNDNASAGNVGELIKANLAIGSALTYSNNTPTNITSISLTAGDWDVSGIAYYSAGGAGSASQTTTSVSTTSATQAGADSGAQTYGAAIAANINYGGVVPTSRLSLASTTTVYLVAQATLSGTVVGWGTIRARRVR